MAEKIIEMAEITKKFGNVIANDNVSFALHKGEIHALLGENGAGKSTLMNMLSGIYSPDKGTISIHGKKVKFNSPKDAIDAGIGMVYQHFKLVDIFTAKENIILGQKGSFFISGKKISEHIKEIAEKFKFDIDVDKKIYNMSVGEKQTVEILKVLNRGTDILILDEPTAVLTPQETEKLFAILRRMRDDGCGIIIITHKLHEVMEISDRVTILRKGTAVKTVNTSETNPKELTDLMVGKSVDLHISRPKVENNDSILRVKNLTVIDDDKIKVLDDVTFEMKTGEILGVAGVAGSGQKELCESIAGIQNIAKGEITYENESIVGKTSREIIEKGISLSFIPEDRLGMGLVGAFDMVDNMLLKDYYKQKSLLLDRKEAAEKSKKIIEKLQVSTPGINHPVKQLSGGNIQKVLLGREIDTEPHLLITAYPTRGLDIASSHIIYDLINEQKKNGVAVLYIGEDLDVLLEISDRIMVLCDGRVTGIVDTVKTTKRELGMLMAGETLESIKVVNKDG